MNNPTYERKVDTTLSDSRERGTYPRVISTASNQSTPLYPISSSTKSRGTERSIISTEDHKHKEYIYSQIESIFWEAKRENFEDGMESKFSQNLISFIREYNQDAIESITLLIVYENVNPEVAGEALRWIGRIEHPDSYGFRRWLLERSIILPSAHVRDGALLGIASMDDKHAIKYLKDAINKEECNDLKEDMIQVLEQLES